MIDDIEAWFAAISWWKSAYWAFGLLGVGGTIVFIVLGVMYFPDVLRRIAEGFIRICTFVLSYRVGCAIVAAVLAWILADYIRHSIDDADFAERTAVFRQAQKDRDTRIYAETKDAVLEELALTEKERVVTKAEVKDFTDVPPPTPAPKSDPFRIDPVSRAKLCHIAGKPECGLRKGTGGVRQAGKRNVDSGDRRLPRLVGRSTR